MTLNNSISDDLRRFLIGGGVNTVLTVIIYQLLIIYISPSFAYGVSWIIGFIFLVYVYPNKVFKGASRSLLSRLLCGIVYLLVFSSSLLMIDVMELHGVNPEVIVFIAISFSSIANFILMRIVFRFCSL